MNNTKEFAYLRGAISCTLNALDRDGEAGQPVRKEMADELRLAFGNFIEVSERATPAAASAGAAGTIDTEEFRNLLWAYRADAMSKVWQRSADIVAHIDQHTAAAVEIAYVISKGAVEISNRRIELLQAELEKLRAATAPVSAAPTMGERMAAIILSELDLAGAPVSAAEPAGLTNYADETGGAVKRFGFDCTVTPPDIIPAGNGAYVHYSDYLKLFQQQPLPTTYRQVAGRESARMEPDPAGEWVKRADWAMGQQGYSVVPDEPTEAMLTVDFMEFSVPSGLSYRENRKAMWKAMLRAAKQAGKEG